MKIVTNREVLIGFVLRIVVAFWNGFWGPSFGAEGDAASFHFWASEYAHNPASSDMRDFGVGWIYTKVLGIVYSMTFDSLFIGSVLSCIAWLISAQILYNCLRIFSVDRDMRNKIMWVYSLLPSSIMYTAVTLREPYQLLFVNLAFYAIIKIYYHKVNGHWVTLCVALYCLASLHGALMFFSIFLFAGSLVVVYMRLKKGLMQSNIIKIVLLVPVMLLGLWYGFSKFSNNSNNQSFDLSQGVVSAVETYQQGSLGTDARANYKSDIQLVSTSELMLFIPVSLFQYLFEPLPWHISAVSDIIAVIENILRGWLIWNSIKVLKYAPSYQRKVVLFAIFYYFLLEMIWANGTINWGTASRHHIPALGLLLFSAYAFNRRSLQLK